MNKLCVAFYATRLFFSLTLNFFIAPVNDNHQTILREKVIIKIRGNKKMPWPNVCEIHVHNTSSEKEYASLRLDKYGTLAKTLTPIWPLLSTSNSILRISPTGFRGEKLLLVASADILKAHMYVCA